MLEFDHVIITADDVGAFADELLERTGLAAVEGGRHPGHGTGNWLVPLGDAYLELLFVHDEAEARTSPFGSWVLDRPSDGLGLVCFRTDDADALATRLDRQAVPMSRRRDDGVELHWRLLGLDDATSPARSAFFIEWDVAEDAHPGRMTAPHRTVPVGITGVDLGGDPAQVAARLGQHDLAVRLVGGEPGPRSVTVATSDGEVVITDDGIAGTAA